MVKRQQLASNSSVRRGLAAVRDEIVRNTLVNDLQQPAFLAIMHVFSTAT